MTIIKNMLIYFDTGETTLSSAEGAKNPRNSQAKGPYILTLERDKFSPKELKSLRHHDRGG